MVTSKSNSAMGIQKKEINFFALLGTQIDDNSHLTFNIRLLLPIIAGL